MDNQRRAATKYVMAENKADSTGTRVMASACILPFSPTLSLKIICKITDHKASFGSCLDRLPSMYTQSVMSRLWSDFLGL